MTTMSWPMALEPGEPAVREWNLLPVTAFLADLEARRTDRSPLVLAIDGRSASGKSTLAGRLAELMPASVVVHADDLAWNEPLFQWDHLLREGVLRPAKDGAGVRFTPPAWPRHGRTGAIEVPAAARTLIVEGVGASHASTAGLVDAVIWVQSDRRQAEQRGLARDIASGENGDAAASRAFWDEWDAAECHYLAQDRPWERADLVVAGTSPQPLPDGVIAVVPGPLRPVPVGDGTDQLTALGRYQDEFRATIGLVDPATPIPWCGDWRVADLVEHLTEIHHWAVAKASGAPEPPLTAEPADPAARYAHYAAELRDTLAGLDPDTPAWTLADQGLPPEQHTGTVRFWHRRQALETLVHLWDLRTAGGLAFDPGAEAWLDCLDEVVSVMHPRQLRLGRIRPPAVRVHFQPEETERVWEVAGADPTASAVTVRGPAAALALLAWGRATLDDPRITIDGDRPGLAAVLSSGLTP
ncbi:MAG: maleylpyruvate isomerase family mycothiol-dependent enzyme [Propionicimonas sp.]